MKIRITDDRKEKTEFYDGEISLQDMYNILLELSKLTIFGLIGMLPTIREIYIYTGDKYGSVEIEFVLNNENLYIRNAHLAQILTDSLKNII